MQASLGQTHANREPYNNSKAENTKIGSRGLRGRAR